MTESRGIVEVTCQLNDSATCRGDRYRLMMVFAVLNYRYFRRLNMAAADLSISTLLLWPGYDPPYRSPFPGEFSTSSRFSTRGRVFWRQGFSRELRPVLSAEPTFF
jgi:hypothetical protein